MLIWRCAWHSQYRGYPLWQGIASWRGLRLRFSDGICRRCLATFRAEHRQFLQRRSPAGPPGAEPTPACAPPSGAS